MANDKTKSASQAWRKKPRKFAPKSRLGCKTCKIRRIKCDLSQPSCLKCQSTGRTCDGYSETNSLPKAETKSSHYRDATAGGAEGRDKYHHNTTISAYRPSQRHAKHHSPIPHNPRPFMVLPTTRSSQSEAMGFFEFISIKHLNEYHPCESWRDTLMFFSQTSPSVRCAAMALALAQRGSLDHDSTGHTHQPQSSEAWAPGTAPLLYYNRAIQHLLNQNTGDSTETSVVTLFVCYLFICFDQMTGNDGQATEHLRAGVQLSRSIEKSNKTNADANPSGVHTLICQITRQIRRLDMQAVMFLADWTPADIQETLVTQLPPLRSLDQAADLLQVLVARVMRLRYSDQRLTTEVTMPAPSSTLIDTVIAQLATWSSLFEKMLQQENFYAADPTTDRFISLLRLQHTLASIFLESYGPGREMEYDNFLPQFQQCVALAGDIAAEHGRYSGSMESTYTPEIGILPMLYIIGVKCRHPMVRREALRILRRQLTREAVWNSVWTARVVERVIEIEEAGLEPEEIAQCTEQIPVWQRVEALSWIHIDGGQGAARLDLSYTLCAQEGLHTESLML